MKQYDGKTKEEPNKSVRKVLLKALIVLCVLSAILLGIDAIEKIEAQRLEEEALEAARLEAEEAPQDRKSTFNPQVVKKASKRHIGY